MRHSPPPSPAYADLDRAVARYGLALRGGFVPEAGDGVPEVAPGVPARALVLVGNLGGAMWAHFSRFVDGERHPLDRWTKTVIEPVAEAFGGRAVFPFDEPPLPFQRWARRAEGLASSPLGILIHPEYGLWHAYRAALLFSVEMPGLAAAPAAAAPCDTCADRPCLTACPVGAFRADGYDVPACAGHLATPASTPCHAGGCRARDACPVGREHRYPDAQIRFHMAAFARAIGGSEPAAD